MRQNTLPPPPSLATLRLLQYKHLIHVISVPLAFLICGLWAIDIYWAFGWSAISTSALMVALFVWRGSFNIKRAKPLRADRAHDAAALSFIKAAGIEHRPVKRYLEQLNAMGRPICWHDTWEVMDWVFREHYLDPIEARKTPGQ